MGCGVSAHRYFCISNHEAYETTRLSLDAVMQFPEGETVYAPLDSAPKAASGQVLLAIRTQHCDIPAIDAAILEMLANGWGVEVSGDQYAAMAPQVAPLR